MKTHVIKLTEGVSNAFDLLNGHPFDQEDLEHLASVTVFEAINTGRNQGKDMTEFVHEILFTLFDSGYESTVKEFGDKSNWEL